MDRSLDDLLKLFDCCIESYDNHSINIEGSSALPKEVKPLISHFSMCINSMPINKLGFLEAIDMHSPTCFRYTVLEQNRQPLATLLFLLSEKQRFKEFSAAIDKEIEQELDSHN